MNIQNKHREFPGITGMGASATLIPSIRQFSGKAISNILLWVVTFTLFSFTTVKAGAVVFTIYTLHNNVMKMTAQLEEQTGSYPDKVQLEIFESSSWKEISETGIVNPGWTAPFKVQNWDSSKDITFRVVYDGDTTWSGVIRKDPVDKDTIIVAAFTGNSVNNGGGAVAKTDIIENVKKHGADLLVFTGDQVYNHNDHFTYWLQFGRDFGELMRDIPAVCLPDDHDVGQGNLYGEGGIVGSGMYNYAKGGYVKSAEYVKEVERAQTSHLPDPYDPTPVAQGIGVYYTEMTYGGISFAIIEDRKFKTGPEDLIPDEVWSVSGTPNLIALNTPGYEPSVVDVPGAVLLGERQLTFLRDWAADWKGAEMKAVLCQSVFANVAHLHGGTGESARKEASLDSNGWPQTGRNKALYEIRKAFALMICGDTHLSNVVQHGIDEWNDACYSMCVPSIANFFPRCWVPLENGVNHLPGKPYTGQFVDGLDNKIFLWAVANPGDYGMDPAELHDKAPGYGIVKFDKRGRTITMESWQRYVDPREPGAKPYEDWPIIIDQKDNYGREAVECLPTLDIKGMNDPVVQIIDEYDSEIVYTLRIKGTIFEKPKVFKTGLYTIKVGELGTINEEVVTGIQSISCDIDSTIIVQIGPVSINNKTTDSKAVYGKINVRWQKLSKQVYLELPGEENYLIDIITVNGAIAISRKVRGPGIYLMSIPDLATGMYMIKVLSGGKATVRKIMAVK